MKNKSQSIKIHTWEGFGYQPVVNCRGWIVALMNWEERFDLQYIRAIERHLQTDEVFVLLQGESALFILHDDGIDVQKMIPGVVYNVPAGVWHSVVGSRDAKWLIVESSDVSMENSEYRHLSKAEKDVVYQQIKALFHSSLSSADS